MCFMQLWKAQLFIKWLFRWWPGRSLVACPSAHSLSVRPATYLKTATARVIKLFCVDHLVIYQAARSESATGTRLHIVPRHNRSTCAPHVLLLRRLTLSLVDMSGFSQM